MNNTADIDVKVVAERLSGVKELIVQHDKLIQDKVEMFNQLQKENKELYRELTKELWKEHNSMMQLAIDKADLSMDARLAGMNEFRAQINDIIKTFASDEKLAGYMKASTERFDNNIKVQNDKVYALERQMDDKLFSNIKTIVEKFETINKASHDKIEGLEGWKNNMQGRGFVLLLAWPILVAIIAYILSHLPK